MGSRPIHAPSYFVSPDHAKASGCLVSRNAEYQPENGRQISCYHITKVMSAQIKPAKSDGDNKENR
jgi:hypothetical protein